MAVKLRGDAVANPQNGTKIAWGHTSVIPGEFALI